MEYRHADGTPCQHPYCPGSCPGRTWRIDRSRLHGGRPADRLRNERLTVWQACKELADRVATEDRMFTTAEMDLWDALNEKMRVLDARIAAMASVRPGGA